MINALILAAGLGTRLRPLTNSLPKCLIDINGEPLLGIWLSKLKALNINKVLINTHYQSKMVENYISNKYFGNNVTLYHEDVLLGTAGTLLKNINFFCNHDCFLIHADNFCDDDLKQMLYVHNHRPKHCMMTMLVFETDKPKESGIVSIDEHNIIQEFQEKIDNPKNNLANGAVYILSSQFLEEIKNFDFRDINDFSTQVIPKFIGRILSYKTNKLFRDVGTLESYNYVNNYFKRKEN